MKILIEESVLRQALECLNKTGRYEPVPTAMLYAVTGALQSALDAAEKVEPVAWKDTMRTEHGDGTQESEPMLLGYEGWQDLPDGTDLYTRPAVPAILYEAHDYGQFADDFDQPLAKPIRKAIRDMLSTAQTLPTNTDSEQLSAPHESTALVIELQNEVESQRRQIVTLNDSLRITSEGNFKLRAQLAECERELDHWKGRGTMGQIAQWRSDAEQLDSMTKQRDELVKALNGMIDLYCRLANSGDCGFWDPQEDAEVVAANAALAKVGVGGTGEM